MRTLLNPFYDEEQDLFLEKLADIRCSIQELVAAYLEKNIGSHKEHIELNNCVVIHAILGSLLSLGISYYEDQDKFKRELICSIDSHFIILRAVRSN